MRIEDRTIDLSPLEGARLVALGLAREARAAAKALAAGAGDEPLHEFRVAVRRLRSVLRTFRPWLEGAVRPRHEKRLKRIARATNEARDAEVQLAWVTAQRALAPARHRAGYELVVARLEARAHGELDAARVAERYRRASVKLERRLRLHEREVEAGGDGDAPFGAVLASLILAQTGVLAGKMEAIRNPSDEAAVHRARIEAKRLRYLLEPLRDHRHGDASTAVGHLKRLQDVLGDLHDAHLLAAELREALADAAARRARALHAAIYEPRRDGAVRDALRADPRPGLLALLRLASDRRDARHAELERGWRPGGMDTLGAEARGVAAALQARARSSHGGGPAGVADPARPDATARSTSSTRGAVPGSGVPVSAVAPRRRVR